MYWIICGYNHTLNQTQRGPLRAIITINSENCWVISYVAIIKCQAWYIQIFNVHKCNIYIWHIKHKCLILPLRYIFLEQSCWTMFHKLFILLCLALLYWVLLTLLVYIFIRLAYMFTRQLQGEASTEDVEKIGYYIITTKHNQRRTVCILM